ncbi:MAG: hypothetical protein KDK91_17240 [Gammaproteobacteria bacterium]|nr:hypothetical protein [Gammaproteobacteria bacterium]
MFCALLLRALLFAGLSAGSQPALAQSSSLERPVHRLVRALQRSEPYAQQDFALVALGEMATEYEQAIERVESQRESDPRKSYKRHRWLRATNAQLQQLYQLMEFISDGEPVQVVANPPGEVQIVTDHKTVLVSSIQDGDPRRFESRVMRSYCEAAGCEAGRFGRLNDLAESDARWSFADNQGNVFRTEDGLRFMFTSLRDRKIKSAACERAAAELRLLAEQLAAVERRGVEVEWSGVAVSGSERSLVRIRLNSAGDVLKVELPAIRMAPDLVVAARRWLEARAHGQSLELILPGADLMLARLILSG